METSVLGHFLILLLHYQRAGWASIISGLRGARSFISCLLLTANGAVRVSCVFHCRNFGDVREHVLSRVDVRGCLVARRRRRRGGAQRTSRVFRERCQNRPVQGCVHRSGLYPQIFIRSRDAVAHHSLYSTLFCFNTSTFLLHARSVRQF